MDTETTALAFLLTAEEIADMDRLENTIQRGLDTFMEVGSALAEINERKLYRQTHHTFADYCRQRWDLGKSRAYQLISAAQVTARIASTVVDIVAPANEAQARPLSQLAPERQTEAWQRAVATAPEGEVTGEHVQAVVDQMLGKSGRFDNKLYYPVDDKGRRVFNAPGESIYSDPRFYGLSSVTGRNLNQERRFEAYSLVELPDVHPQDLKTVLPSLVDQNNNSAVWPVDRTRRIIFDAPFPSEAMAAKNLYSDCTWMVAWDMNRQWYSVMDCLGEFEIRPARLLLTDWAQDSKFQPGMSARCPTCMTVNWLKDRAVSPFERWRIVEQDVWACPHGHRVADADLDFNVEAAVASGKTTPEQEAKEKAKTEAQNQKLQIEFILDHVTALDDLLDDIAKIPNLVREALTVDQIKTYCNVSWREKPSSEALSIAIGWLAHALKDESVLEMANALSEIDFGGDQDDDEDDDIDENGDAEEQGFSAEDDTEDADIDGEDEE